MSIIQKRADELKPGDVVKGTDDAQNDWVMLRKWDSTQTEIKIVFGVFGGGTVNTWFPAGQYFEMAESALTPAQQHAEELLIYAEQYLRRLESEHEGATVEALRELVQKIKPPEPPTLEEALAALDKMVAMLSDELPDDDHDILNAVSIRDRARRAGLLK